MRKNGKDLKGTTCEGFEFLILGFPSPAVLIIDLAVLEDSDGVEEFWVVFCLCCHARSFGMRCTIIVKFIYRVGD